MSGRVVFALTEHQAAAILALSSGRPLPTLSSPRSRTILESTLFDRGLVASSAAGLVLTDLGHAAASVAARLARRSTG